MKPEDRLPREYIGSLCEIITYNKRAGTNQLLNVGRLDTVKLGVLELVPRREGMVFSRIPVATFVNIYVFSRNLPCKILKGVIDESDSLRIRILNVEPLTEAEQRGALRYDTKAPFFIIPYAAALRLSKETTGFQVTLTDLSQTGLQFSSDASFEEGDIFLGNVKMFNISLQFKLRVERQFERPSKHNLFYYGCRFMSPSDEFNENLRRILMRLQLERLSRLSEE